MDKVKEIFLEIVSPEVVMVKENVQKIIFPGELSDFMVLYNHAPIISSLREGRIRYSQGSEDKSLFIKSGFLIFKNNRAEVCVEV